MRRLLAFSCALALLAVAPSTAFAETTFGGNPALTPTATYEGQSFDCGYGEPFPITPHYGTPPGQGHDCTWSSAGGAEDFVPFGPSGGSGVISAVTLPAMTNPGPMQAVVLTGTEFIPTGAGPGQVEFACCKIKEVSPAFTVPANQVATVPLDLAVASQPSISKPGETDSGDIMALSMLSTTASMPLLETNSERDYDYVYWPARTAPEAGYVEPGTTEGFQLLAQFHLGPVPTPTPTPTPAASPAEGVKLRGAVTVKPGDKIAVLGKATDPPTESTTETLTGTLPAGGHAAHAAAVKATKLGVGKAKIAGGKSAPITVKLSAATRAALAHGATIDAKAKIVATGPSGTKTVTKSLTLKEAAKKHH